MLDKIRKNLISVLAVALSVFTVYDVNFAGLRPLTQLAVFALLGMGLCFVIFPINKRWKDNQPLRVVDLLLALAVALCCGLVIWRGEEITQHGAKWWDVVVMTAGILLVLEATRRSIGWALPILAGAFLLYAYFGPSMPNWAFPHQGYSIDRIAEQCFAKTDGVFGVAMRVMFTYVFLFVIFGAFLEMSGATQYIIDFARRVFGRFAGGPGMVSVAGAGLMGSLSGSAVANAVTTGTFTIPMMRSSGYSPHIAGGITAAASSGGALMPPIMGAGAYMMLEIIDPPVTFLQIMKAAIVPAILYYLSLLLIVYFYSQRIGASQADSSKEKPRLLQYSGLVFFGSLGALIAFLIAGFTPFRSVTYSLEVILLLTILSPKMPFTIFNRIVSLMVWGAVTVGVTFLPKLLNGVPILQAKLSDVPLFRPLTIRDTPLGDWSTWADSAIPAMLIVLLLGLFHPQWRKMVHEAFLKSARGGIALVSASGCVGIVIGVVGLTGVGTAFPQEIVPLAQQSLLLALIAIMVCSIILGMGLPSAVCYLLMAQLIGPVLTKLGVIPLAAHLFIFYFGMMSMVTPPVALAAYASAGIAKANIMPTAMAAFRFALVGFTLPFMFIYRPELLILSDKPEPELVNVQVKDQETNPRVVINAVIKRNEQPHPNMKIELTPHNAEEGAANPITLRTQLGGRVQFDLTAGDWTVSSFSKLRDHIKLSGQQPVELSQGEWLETADGQKVELAAGQSPPKGEYFVVADGRRRHLGILTVDPAHPAPEENETDQRAEFLDQRLSPVSVLIALGAAVLGIVSLAAGIAGFFKGVLSMPQRGVFMLAAGLLLLPEIRYGGRDVGEYVNLIGAVLFTVMAIWNWRFGNPAPPLSESE